MSTVSEKWRGWLAGRFNLITAEDHFAEVKMLETQCLRFQELPQRLRDAEWAFTIATRKWSRTYKNTVVLKIPRRLAENIRGGELIDLIQLQLFDAVNGKP